MWRHAAAMVLACSTGLAWAQGAGDERYRVGVGLLHRGVHDLAAEEFRAYLKDHADGDLAANARYSLGVCLARTGRAKEAAAELERVAKEKDFEFAGDAALLLGQCRFDLGEFEAAAGVLGGLARAHPEFGALDRAAALRGEALFRAGKIEEAREALRGFGERWPTSEARARGELFGALADAAAGDARAAAARAAALRAMDSPHRARATLLEAQCRHRLNEVEAARTLYREAAEGGDATVTPDALLGLARATRTLGQAREAGKVLDQLSKVEASKDIRAAAALESARVRFDLGEFDTALRELAALGKDAPPALAPEAELLAGKCELKLSRADRARERLARAIERFPKSEHRPTMLYDLGVALWTSGQASEAADAFGRVATEHPKHDLAAEAIASRASCLHQGAKYGESLALCEAFVRERASHARAEEMRLLAAENLYFAERFEEAERAYRAFAAAHPSSARAGHAGARRGLCLSALGRGEEARGVLESALNGAGSLDAELVKGARTALTNAALGRSDWREGEKHLAALLEGTKDGAERAGVLLRLGLCQAHDWRSAEAAQSFERAIEAGASAGEVDQARFERGRALLALDRVPEAKAEFERVAKSEESAWRTPARQHLASIAMREGRTDEALMLLRQVSESAGTGEQEGNAADGATASALYQQGLILLSNGKAAEGEAALRKFLERFAGDERAPSARARLAIAASRLGRHEEALEGLDAALRNADALEADLPAMLRYERGWVLRALGRKGEARRALEAVTTAETPETLRAHAALELARLSVEEDRHEQALSELDACRAAMKGLDRGASAGVGEHEAYLRGVCEAKLKKASAAETLAAFLNAYPDSASAPSARMVLAERHVQDGRAGEAAAELERVLAAKVGDELASAALLRLGEARSKAQQWVKADEAFGTFLTRFPKSEVWFQARFGLGWARENQGRHEAAIEEYRAVTAKHQGPTAARAQFQIGECLFALKRHDEALREFTKVDVLHAYPEWSAAAGYEGGRCLLELKKIDEAKRLFEDVRTRFPETPWAKLAGERLEAMKPAALPGRGERK